MEVAEFQNLLWDYTRKISENSNKAFGLLAEKYGLTILQVRILMALYHNGCYTIGNLAEDICVAGTNLSPMCKKLEKMDCLKRIRDQEDERIVKVTLTEKGNGIVLEIDKELNQKIMQYIDFEVEKALEEIIAGVHKLNDVLLKISQN